MPKNFNTTDYDTFMGVFTKGVPLGIRNIKGKTSFSIRKLLHLSMMAINDGKLRRVKPQEVGSNKFEWTEFKGDNKKGIEKKFDAMPLPRRFQVFTLTD